MYGEFVITDKRGQQLETGSLDFNTAEELETWSKRHVQEKGNVATIQMDFDYKPRDIKPAIDAAKKRLPGYKVTQSGLIIAIQKN